ncbi:hypothetical protein ABKN59_006074 [Abortiporus biennis]
MTLPSVYANPCVLYTYKVCWIQSYYCRSLILLPSPLANKHRCPAFDISPLPSHFDNKDWTPWPASSASRINQRISMQNSWLPKFMPQKFSNRSDYKLTHCCIYTPVLVKIMLRDSRDLILVNMSWATQLSRPD